MYFLITTCHPCPESSHSHINTDTAHTHSESLKISNCPNMIGRETKDSFHWILMKFLLAFYIIPWVPCPPLLYKRVFWFAATLTLFCRFFRLLCYLSMLNGKFHLPLTPWLNSFLFMALTPASISLLSIRFPLLSAYTVSHLSIWNTLQT